MESLDKKIESFKVEFIKVVPDGEFIGKWPTFVMRCKGWPTVRLHEFIRDRSEKFDGVLFGEVFFYPGYVHEKGPYWECEITFLNI